MGHALSSCDLPGMRQTLLIILLVSDGQSKDGCERETDYLCGDKCIRYDKDCHCAADILHGSGGLPSSYCCLADGASTCQYRRGAAHCRDGKVTNLTEVCAGACHVEYRTTINQTGLGGLRATYMCASGDSCAPVRDMCSGTAACRDQSDLAECNENLQCISTNGQHELTWHRYHHACLYETSKNDGEYDNIHRKDEQYLTLNDSRVNFAGITQCDFQKEDKSGLRGRGLQCGEEGKCSPPWQWCLDRRQHSVTTTQCGGNFTLISDDKTLCKNTTFWSQHEICNIYYDDNKKGELFALGSRCTGNLQHCYYPWYTFNWNVYTRQKYAPTCSDNSDKIFHINSRCNTSHYVDIYCDKICRPGKELEYCNREICDVRTVSQWLEDNKDDKLLMDPHDCQSSCSSPGPECEACTNTDYFRCTDGATCLHPDLLCDGHQHCQDGSDEDFDFCYFKSQLYLKKNIVEEFATLVCHSKMYPLIFTVATVCDGIRECYGDKDEPPSCTNSIAADIGISCIVIITIAFYFLQKWILEYFVTSPDNGTEDIELEDTEFEKEESYMALHEREDFQYRINCYLARLKYSKDAPQVAERINLIR